VDHATILCAFRVVCLSPSCYAGIIGQYSNFMHYIFSFFTKWRTLPRQISISMYSHAMEWQTATLIRCRTVSAIYLLAFACISRPAVCCCVIKTTSRCYQIHNSYTDNNQLWLLLQVMVNLHSAHMDPDDWQQPQQFRPERFLDDSCNVIHRDRIIPFSLGIWPLLLTASQTTVAVRSV